MGSCTTDQQERGDSSRGSSDHRTRFQLKIGKFIISPDKLSFYFMVMKLEIWWWFSS
jgi:hypothetical protein